MMETTEQIADSLMEDRLARTPYLVLPKLALKAMTLDWQRRFELMMREMEQAGIETPSYIVLRDDGEGGEYTRARAVNDVTGFVRICGGKIDPWANYKYGDAFELSSKSPIIP